MGTVGKVNPVEECLLCKSDGLDVVILERAQVTAETPAPFVFTPARADCLSFQVPESQAASARPPAEPLEASEPGRARRRVASHRQQDEEPLSQSGLTMAVAHQKKTPEAANAKKNNNAKESPITRKRLV